MFLRYFETAFLTTRADHSIRCLMSLSLVELHSTKKMQAPDTQVTLNIWLPMQLQLSHFPLDYDSVSCNYIIEVEPVL